MIIRNVWYIKINDKTEIIKYKDVIIIVYNVYGDSININDNIMYYDYDDDLDDVNDDDDGCNAVNKHINDI